MTLDNLECQNGFYKFFDDFALQDTFQERIASKSMQKLSMEFSALNVDFDGSGLDFLGSRKPAHEGIKERYLHKSCYFTVVGMLLITTSTIDDLFGCINIDDFERP